MSFYVKSKAFSPVFRPAWSAAGLMNGAAIIFDAASGALAPFLSHSAAGNRMMTDALGNLTYAPNNLLTYSNTFSNAAWSTQAATVTAIGATDPIGGNAAHRLQFTAGTAGYLYRNSFEPSTKVIFGVWVRSNTSGNQTFRLYGRSTLTQSSDLVATTAWQLFYLNYTGNGGSVGIKSDGSNSSADLLIYAAVLSSVAYETTPRQQDQVITTSAAYYGPRVPDYQYGGVAGLTSESAKTNLFLTSEAPATQTITVVSGQTYTVSFYGTGSITLTGAATQTMTGTGAFPTRTKYTFVAASTSLTATVGGTITNPMVELGAFASSYIPAGASAVTRAADTFTMVNLASNPAIAECYDIATGVVSRTAYASGIGATLPQDKAYRKIAIYPLGTTATYLNARLTVGGPF